MHFDAETSNRKFLARPGLTYLSLPSLPSLASTTLYHANRRSLSPFSFSPPGYTSPRRSDHRRRQTRDILSAESGDFSPARYQRGCENMPGRAKRGARTARWGCRVKRGKRHLLPPALPRVSLRGGLTPCVGATRIPSGTEERKLRHGGESERASEREKGRKREKKKECVCSKMHMIRGKRNRKGISC